MVAGFKSRWFAKAARQAGISDDSLVEATTQAMSGQADDLGGGVYKKRLRNNQMRAILLARGGEIWVFEFLFAKQDRAAIDDAELKAFRALAKAYAALKPDQIAALIRAGDWASLAMKKPEGEP